MKYIGLLLCVVAGFIVGLDWLNLLAVCLAAIGGVLVVRGAEYDSLI